MLSSLFSISLIAHSIFLIRKSFISSLALFMNCRVFTKFLFLLNQSPSPTVLVMLAGVTLIGFPGLFNIVCTASFANFKHSSSFLFQSILSDLGFLYFTLGVTFSYHSLS